MADDTTYITVNFNRTINEENYVTTREVNPNNVGLVKKKLQQKINNLQRNQIIKDVCLVAIFLVGLAFISFGVAHMIPALIGTGLVLSVGSLARFIWKKKIYQVAKDPVYPYRVCLDVINSKDTHNFNFRPDQVLYHFFNNNHEFYSPIQK